MKGLENTFDLVILSTETYDELDARSSLVFSRIAQNDRVYFVQPGLPVEGAMGGYSVALNEHGIRVVQPYVPSESSIFEKREFKRAVLLQLLQEENLYSYSVWLDSPRSMPLIRTLTPQKVYYERHEERGQRSPELEHELLQYADVIFDERELSYAALEAQGTVTLWERSISN